MIIWMLIQSIEAVCPIIQCSPLDIGVCAISGPNQTITINYNGCISKTYCEVSEYINWYNNGGSYLHCQEFPNMNLSIYAPYFCSGLYLYCQDTSAIDYSSYSNVNCGVRDESTMLLDDIHPKQCRTDKDCILKNLNTSPCLCGMDGNSYCMPQWGSEVFEAYWNKCNNNNGYMVSYWWFYWSSLQKYYNYYIAAPDCAMNIFAELQVLNLEGVNAFSIKLILSLWALGLYG
jgi:hypothetical protein